MSTLNTDRTTTYTYYTPTEALQMLFLPFHDSALLKQLNYNFRVSPINGVKYPSIVGGVYKAIHLVFDVTVCIFR